MNPSILSIATALPTFCHHQSDLANRLSEGHRLSEEISLKQKRIFRATGIESRYSVLADFGVKGLKGDFFGDHYPEVSPPTSQRNAFFIQEAPKLAACAAEKALANWGRERKHEMMKSLAPVALTGLAGVILWKVLQILLQKRD